MARRPHYLGIAAVSLVLLAAAGRAVAQAPAPSTPAWLSELSPLQSAQFTSTAISAIDPEDNPDANPNHPGSAPWHGTSGQAAVVNAWNQVAIDRVRHELMQTGGGHGDYGGHEFYRYRYGIDEPTVELWDYPSTDVSNPGTGDAAYTDGTPAPSHNYAWLEYHPGADVIVRPMSSTSFPTREEGQSVIWHFDRSVELADKSARHVAAWSKSTATNSLPGGQRGFSAYNPRDGLLWVGSSDGPPAGLGTYDPTTETFTTLVSGYGPGVGMGTSPVAVVAHDYGSNGLLVIWRSNQNGLYAVDLSNVATRGTCTVSDPSSMLGNARPLAYDPINACIWTWAGGNTLGRMNIPADPLSDTWTVTTETVTGAGLPASPPVQGIYQRVRWDAIAGIPFLLVVNITTENIRAVRLPNG